MDEPAVLVGTAGWSIPGHLVVCFPGEGPVLARYARALDAVEINTTFYRNHRPATFAAWAALVPDRFRFSVKAPRFITHYHRLGPAAGLELFLEGVAHLGPKLGPLLFQLPPGLSFQPGIAAAFLGRLRARFEGLAALEPRHPSWFGAEADHLLRESRVARVAADPAVCKAAALPGGWEGLVYYRLHGSPRMYWSVYAPEALERQAEALRSRPAAPSWCVFDNTGAGEATANALRLKVLLADGTRPERVHGIHDLAQNNQTNSG